MTQLVARAGQDEPEDVAQAPGPADRTQARSGRGILVVTRHYPPSAGGVASFTEQFVRRLPAQRVVVLAPDAAGAAEVDAGSPFPVYRYRRSLLRDPRLPARLAELVRAHDLGAAWITAAAPLVALAPLLRRAGVQRIVASSHGQERAWARIPVIQSALSLALRRIDVLTYLGEVTRPVLAKRVRDRAELVHLSGGVDTEFFRPDVDPAAVRAVRERHRLDHRPVVVSVSRLVTRKGHDRLIDAWSTIRDSVPDAALVVVGDGSARDKLQRRVAEHGHHDSVIFTGSVPAPELPAYLAAGDVFALPIRDRIGGLETEGLGLAILEASAAGLPVVVGRSGGTPTAVQDGQTGQLVDGKDTTGIAGAVIGLLTDRDRAAAMGAAGRAWVEDTWTWDALASRLMRQFDG